ncbi:L10-interacting MYB domain-containing protein-like [Bidens hawaiensis]|uniref:L10-interacting MYB domain-containing protein-like n=1 Tax=Bidens hawaiensis TaxID=980011 RepID=UPI00404A57C6
MLRNLLKILCQRPCFLLILSMGDKRLKLTTEQEKLFLETCIEETVRVGYMGVSLQRESWAVVGKKLLEAYGMAVEQKKLKNKYDYLREKYLAWSYLKRKTGNIYNPHTNMFTLTNEDWDVVCKVHPKAASLKTTPLANHELCATLFDKNSTTCSIRRPIALRRASSSSQASVIPLLQIDSGPIESLDDENTYEETVYYTAFEGDSSIPKNTNAPKEDRGWANKKAKHTINLTDLEVDMRKVIANLAENKPVRPTIDECHDKLKGLGLEVTDPIFLAAFGIFSQPSNNYREAWMTLPSNPEVLKNWITMMAKTLGIMK